MSTYRSVLTAGLVLCCLIAAGVDAGPVAAAKPKPAQPPTTATAPTTRPWAADFPAFANAAADRHWVVGRSSKPCLSESEAAEQARRDAGSQVRALLRPHLSSRWLDGDAEAWLKGRVDRELVLGRLIVERSLSKVHRPYADIWSGAVLVDASGDRLAPIVRDYQEWRQVRTHTLRRTGFSVLGFSAAILAIYAVMNALTKGYFRGRLRAGAGLVMGLGAGWLIWLARVAG